MVRASQRSIETIVQPKTSTATRNNVLGNRHWKHDNKIPNDTKIDIDSTEAQLTCIVIRARTS